MKDKQTITVIVHVFYPGSWEKISTRVSTVLQSAANIIITFCNPSVLQEIKLPGAVLLRVTNVGKDIGGKLSALQYYLEFCSKTDYIIFLHDKKSPQSLDPEFWFDSLYSIFTDTFFQKTIKFMNQNHKTGLIGAKQFIKSDYTGRGGFNSSNSSILRTMITQFRLKNYSFDYVAGTIFIVRSTIFEAFFKTYPPLDIRKTLEPGNVMDHETGSHTHSWERMFCFIPQSAGYKVKGLG